MNLINWWRAFMAACFFVAQNKHFGWNAWPQSDAELIADGITFLLFALSINAPQGRKT